MEISVASIPLPRLFTEREAAAQSEIVLDRAQRLVYEAIRARSIAGSRGFVFSHEDQEFRLPVFVSTSARVVLAELTLRQLILPIPFFAFEEGSLSVDCSFVARIGEMDIIDRLYADAIGHSLHAIRQWMESPDDICAGLRADMERDLNAHNSSKTPELEALEQPGVLLDPATELQRGDYIVRPPDEVLTGFAAEIVRQLSLDGQACYFEGTGFLWVHPERLIEVYEEAVNFVDELVVPSYATRPQLNRQFIEIGFEEAVHNLDATQAPTVRFGRDRAGVIKEALLAENPGARAPLPVEIVLRLAPRAEQHYINEWKEHRSNDVESFKNLVWQHGNDWQRMLRYVRRAEFLKQHPDVWARLQNHPELLHINYEMPGGTIHIFAPRDIMIFPDLIRNMIELPVSQRWQITALKSLIEAHEEYFKPLFGDPEFVRTYGRLLRKAYVDHMPVYTRVLLYTGIGAVLDYFFSRAKERIRKQQAWLAKRNLRELEKRRTQERERARQAGLEMRDAARASAVDTELENCYFYAHRVPTIESVAQAVGEENPQEFLRLMRKFKFGVLKTTADEDLNGGVVLFPRDQNFNERMEQVRQILPEILEKLKSENGNGLSRELRRAQGLQNFLSRNRKTSAAAPGTAG